MLLKMSVFTCLWRNPLRCVSGFEAIRLYSLWWASLTLQVCNLNSFIYILLQNWRYFLQCFEFEFNNYDINVRLSRRFHTSMFFFINCLHAFIKQITVCLVFFLIWNIVCCIVNGGCIGYSKVVLIVVFTSSNVDINLKCVFYYFLPYYIIHFFLLMSTIAHNYIMLSFVASRHLTKF